MKGGVRRNLVRGAALAAAFVAAAASAPAATAPPIRVVRLPGHPFVGAVVYGYRAVWVASHVGYDVFRVDPATGRVVGRVHVGENQCVQPAVGAGAIWEPNCWGETGQGFVHEISARRMRVVRRIRGEGVAFGDGSLWTVADDGPPALLRIDPRSAVVLARIELPVAPPRYWFPGGVCYGSVWATVDTQVVRFDTATNTVAGVIPLPASRSSFAPKDGFFSANVVACAGGKVWVPNLAGLYAIDPDTNAAQRLPIAMHAFSALGDVGITAARDHVFVRTSDSQVAEVDPALRRVVATYAAGGGGGAAIAVADGALWVPNAALGTVWREQLKPLRR